MSSGWQGRAPAGVPSPISQRSSSMRWMTLTVASASWRHISAALSSTSATEDMHATFDVRRVRHEVHVRRLHAVLLGARHEPVGTAEDRIDRIDDLPPRAEVHRQPHPCLRVSTYNASSTAV